MWIIPGDKERGVAVGVANDSPQDEQEDPITLLTSSEVSNVNFLQTKI